MKTFQVWYRGPYNAIDSKPRCLVIAAINRNNVVWKFRAFNPNAEIVEIVETER